jgi:hypothetical protein
LGARHGGGGFGVFFIPTATPALPSVKNAREIARQLKKDWLIDVAKRSALNPEFQGERGKGTLYENPLHTLFRDHWFTFSSSTHVGARSEGA